MDNDLKKFGVQRRSLMRPGQVVADIDDGISPVGQIEFLAYIYNDYSNADAALIESNR